MTLVRPSVADEPLRKWPSSLSVLRSFFSLGDSQQCTDEGGYETHRLVSIFVKVPSAWVKKS